MNAAILAPPAATYRGTLTNPDRWATWVPHAGDILVCTPPKCGTTWTQSILAMLLAGGPDLPGRISVISPWVDANLGEAEVITASLAGQDGRRVVKTHTPADGFGVWEGVRVVAVYRHPLDVFFSLRKHALNMKADPDHPMRAPVDEALEHFLHAPMSFDDFDRDSLATVVRHYRETVLSGRLPELTALHYADMVADGPAAVAHLNEVLGIGADAAAVEAVAEATGFAAMKARAADYVPEGGKGFWENDAAFFDSGGTGKWAALPPSLVSRFEDRLAELVPESAARTWLLQGAGQLSGPV